MGREPGLGRGEVRTCGQLFKGGGWAPSLSQVRWNPQAPRGSSRFPLFLVLNLSLAVSVPLYVCLCLLVSLHLSFSLGLSPPDLPSPPPHHLQAHLHLAAVALCPRSPGGLLGWVLPRCSAEPDPVLAPCPGTGELPLCPPEGVPDPGSCGAFSPHLCLPLSLGLRTVASMSVVCPGSLWYVWKLLEILGTSFSPFPSSPPEWVEFSSVTL